MQIVTVHAAEKTNSQKEEVAELLYSELSHATDPQRSGHLGLLFHALERRDDACDGTVLARRGRAWPRARLATLLLNFSLEAVKHGTVSLENDGRREVGRLTLLVGSSSKVREPRGQGSLKGTSLGNLWDEAGPVLPFKSRSSRQVRNLLQQISTHGT